ncbi:hypothetical protein L484_017347 [Morus notabilis]|uniref:Uncharacterized protein n=1 Tax=Morus notabilis TaxID=981085 RepID=W9RGH6_9ROSA|nr:hypothetical protein L484_017347 [Morus notabilis]
MKGLKFGAAFGRCSKLLVPQEAVKDGGWSGVVVAWGRMGVSVIRLCFGSPLSSGGFRLNGVSAPFVWLVPLSMAFGGGDCLTPFRLLFGAIGMLQSPGPLLVVVSDFVESPLVSFGYFCVLKYVFVK